MPPRKSSKTDPQIIEMPSQKMVVVYGKGAPDKVFAELMPALYGSVYTLKFDLKKKGLPREGTEVRVTAAKAGPPARLDFFRIEVKIPLALSEADRAGVEQAVHHCLIHNTLLQPPKIQIELKAPAAV